MARLMAALLVLLPLSASADHLDAIQNKLNDGCTMEKFMAITSDFNEWGKAYGYKAEIAVPIQSQDLTTFFWLGRSADAATFGKAWDAWRDGQADPKSVPAKLQARFDKCSTNVSRTGFDLN